MLARSHSLLTAVLAAPLLALPRAEAQKPSPPSQTVRVVSSGGSDQAKNSTYVARLQARCTADPTFSQRVDNLVAQRKFADAKTLLGAAAQVRVDQVWLGEGAKLSAAPRPSVFHYASFERSGADARERARYLIFTFGKYMVCLGDTIQCTAALKALGATNIR